MAAIKMRMQAQPKHAEMESILKTAGLSEDDQRRFYQRKEETDSLLIGAFVLDLYATWLEDPELLRGIFETRVRTMGL